MLRSVDHQRCGIFDVQPIAGFVAGAAKYQIAGCNLVAGIP